MWYDLIQLSYENHPIMKIRGSHSLIDRDHENQSKRQKREPKVKIVINSVISYRKALTVLLESILASDYLAYNNHDNCSNSRLEIIVSLGQCADQTLIAQSPMLKTIAGITDLASEKQVTVIYCAENNYDWTALHQLYQHRSHELIAADYYLYLLDTCKVDQDHFWKKVSMKITEIITSNDPFRERVMLTSKPHSSIAIFGSGVIENYQRNFRKLSNLLSYPSTN
jgi:hypothetical protein